MTVVEVKVPDIGDFADVPVIELLVGPGDSVAPEDPLVTLESDKATMDVPAPFAGTVRSCRSRSATEVAEGSVLLDARRDRLAGGDEANRIGASPPPLRPPPLPRPLQRPPPRSARPCLRPLRGLLLLPVAAPDRTWWSLAAGRVATPPRSEPPTSA